MFKKKLRFFISEEFIFLFFSLLLFLFSFLPLFWAQIIKTPPDSVFTLAFNYVPDYYQYISWIKDGSAGKLLINSRYSLENFTRQPVYFFYSISGFIAGLFNFNFFLFFHLLRILTGFFKIFVLYLFLTKLLKSWIKRIIAFLLIFFLPPFYNLMPFELLFPFITSIDPLLRTFFLPHTSLSLSLIILTFLSFNKSLSFKNLFSKKNLKTYLMPGVLLGLSGFLNPALTSLFLLVLGLGLGFYLFGLFLKQKSLKQKHNFLVYLVKVLKLAGLAFLFCLPVILYQLYIFKNIEPFAWAFTKQAGINFGLTFKDLLLTFGPGFLFLVLGFKSFFKSKSFLKKVILAWGIFPIFTFPLIGRLIPLSLERLFEASFYIPLGILGGEVIGGFLLKVKKKGRVVFLSLGFLILFLVITIPYIFLSLRFWFDMYSYPYFNIFIPKSVVKSLLWLDNNTVAESGVAAPYYTSSFLPAFSHNKVLFGHDFATFKAEEKLKQLDIIYKSKDEKQVSKVLRENKIDYIIFNQEVPEFKETVLEEVGEFRLVYKNKDVTIYKFID